MLHKYIVESYSQVNKDKQKLINDSWKFYESKFPGGNGKLNTGKCL